MLNGNIFYCPQTIKEKVNKQYPDAQTLLIHACGPESLGCKTSSVSKDANQSGILLERDAITNPKELVASIRPIYASFTRHWLPGVFILVELVQSVTSSYEWRAFCLVSCLNLPYSLDTGQTLVHTRNYNRLTGTHLPGSFTWGLKSSQSQSPTAAHKIRSVKLFLPTAVAWAKQHMQTMVGHAFLEVNTGQGPFPIQPWLCIICFLEVEVYLWGPEKDSWLVEMWPHQPPHTFLWDKLSKEDLNTSCRYDCILAFSLVTRKLTSINRNSSNKL